MSAGAKVMKGLSLLLAIYIVCNVHHCIIYQHVKLYALALIMGVCYITDTRKTVFKYLWLHHMQCISSTLDPHYIQGGAPWDP